MTVNKEIEWNKKVFEAYDSMLRDATTKLSKIREICKEPQYMDEAVLLKINILEVLDS